MVDNPVVAAAEGWPTVTAVLPTLNAQRYLDECLRALREQDYAGEIEILIVDGGSTDRTVAIAREHGVDRILENPLRSGEAGKAVGVKAARGDLILLLDSDNIVVGSDWLRRMVRPFIEDDEVIGCEPARFEYRRQDHPINRWHALLGAADPLTIYTGNYARDSVLTGRWTDCPHACESRDGWERVRLYPNWVPVLGANGFMIRKVAYETVPVGDYLFDLDYVHQLVLAGHSVVGRADVAVRHYFCDGVRRFKAKTRRRVDDYFFFSSSGQRSYPWTGRRTRAMAEFVVSTVLVVPIVREAMRGYRRYPDVEAWAWHVFACWITLLVYATGVIRGRLRPTMLSREGWGQ
jgi:glycosyltransferase involved in cell wall biosynthesis